MIQTAPRWTFEGRLCQVLRSVPALHGSPGDYHLLGHHNGFNAWPKKQWLNLFSVLRIAPIDPQRRQTASGSHLTLLHTPHLQHTGIVDWEGGLISAHRISHLDGVPLPSCHTFATLPPWRLLHLLPVFHSYADGKRSARGSMLCYSAYAT